MRLEYLIRAPRKVPIVVLSLFMIWPFVHMVIVEHYDISRWRFFGWGMYAEPHPYDNTYVKILVSSDQIAGKPCRWYGASMRSDNRLQVSFLTDQVVTSWSDAARNPLFSVFEHLITFGTISSINAAWNDALELVGTGSAEGWVAVAKRRFNKMGSQVYYEGSIYRCGQSCTLETSTSGDLLAKRLNDHLKDWEGKCELDRQ